MEEKNCKKGNSRKQGNCWWGGVADRREIDAGGRKLLEDRELLEGENDWKQGNCKKEGNYLEELLEGRILLM